MKIKNELYDEKMQNSRIFLLCSALVVVIFILLASEAGCEKNPPPVNGGDSAGDWIIEKGDNIERINQEIKLKGNLTIENGGKLTFKNVTLKMNCTEDGEFGIEVKSGGEFYIYDNDLNKETTNDASNITSVDDEFEYHFMVHENSIFEMKYSELSECGYEWGNKQEHLGVWINSTQTIIEENYFSKNPETAIVCYQLSGDSSSLSIKDNIFMNNGCGISIFSSNISIFNNIFMNNEGGIFCMGLDPIISNNEFINNYYGIDSLSSNPKIDNITITKCNIGLGLRNSTPKLRDSKLFECEIDFQFSENSNMTVINTTFDKKKVKFDDEESVLIVCWNLFIKVVDKNNEPINDAIVHLITNKDEILEYSTDSNGILKIDLCLEYVLKKNGEVYFSPYIIKAEKSGLKNETNLQVNKNKEIVIKLTEESKDDGGICIIGFIFPLIVFGCMIITFGGRKYENKYKKW